MSDAIIKVALDIGSSQIKALAGSLEVDEFKVKVLGTAVGETKGVSKAMVTNVKELSESIAKVLRELEEKSQVAINQVSIGIAGIHIKSATQKVNYTFPEGNCEVEERHYDNLYAVATEKIPQDEIILKKEIYNRRVDNSGIIRDPIGLTGSSIEGDVHLITANSTQETLFIEAVNKAGYQVENVTLNALSSSEAILKNSDKQKGVALVDIGAGSTDIIIYKNEKAIYTKSIPIGGQHYINDLSYILKVEKDLAKDLLLTYMDSSKDLEEVEVEKDGEKLKFKRVVIGDILRARTGDVVKYLAKALEDSGFQGYLGNGIKITGGMSNLRELLEELTKSLNYIVEKGEPIKLRGFEEPTAEYATVIGTFIETLEKEYLKLLEEKKEKVEEPKKVEAPIETKKTDVKGSSSKQSKDYGIEEEKKKQKKLEDKKRQKELDEKKKQKKLEEKRKKQAENKKNKLKNEQKRKEKAKENLQKAKKWLKEFI